MLYILGALFFIILIVALAKKDKKKAKQAAQVGGIAAFLLFLLRLGPGIIGNLVNLLVVLLPFLRKSQDNNVEAKAEKMTKQEARDILGVSDSASKKEIKVAYNKMIKKNHPDIGGSKYLAQKIIIAKKILIGE